MRLVTVTSIATLAVAVAALVFALWPVVADAPWENDSELKSLVEQVQYLQIGMSILEAEANTPASESEICKSLTNLMVAAQKGDQGISPEAGLLLVQTGLENGWFADAK